MNHTRPLHELAGLVPVRSATTGGLPHYAETEGVPAVCVRRTGQLMTDREAADAPRFCSHCVSYAEKLVGETAPTEPASPLVAAATALGDLVEETDRRRAAIRVHCFDSTEDVRAAANRDEIGDGDVFVVELENVTGFLVVTLPAAITEKRGAVLHLNRPAHEYAAGEWVDSVVVAEREARNRGFLLRDESPAERISSMRRLANKSAERVRTDPDPQNAEWQMALYRLTLAQSYLSAHDPLTAEAIAEGAREIREELARIDATLPRAADHWPQAVRSHA